MTEVREVVDILVGEISPGVEGWSVITVAPGGIRHQITFPRVALEWRAAEYGLTDPAEILDFLLHEPGLPPAAPEATMVSLANPSQKAANAVAREEPVTLYTAKSTAAARTAHRTRITASKASNVHVTDPQALLQHIVTDHGMNADSVREKRERVDVRRWKHQYGSLPVPPAVPTPLDDTVRLRALDMRADKEGADRA